MYSNRTPSSESRSIQQDDIDTNCEITGIPVGSIIMNLIDPKEIIRNNNGSVIIQLEYLPIKLYSK